MMAVADRMGGRAAWLTRMADETQNPFPIFDEFGAFLPGALPAVEPELDPPLLIVEPEGPISALVVSSPHSGRVYPASFTAAAKLSAQALRRSEDAFVDDLFSGCAQAGAPMLKALFPRAYLDVNREPYELDPRMFDGRLPPFANTRSIRVAGGLGTIARVVGEAQEIYAARLPVEEALRRIEGLYKPYHRTLRELVARARRAHGVAVLVDCHSMPSACAGGRGGERGKSDVVLGDRYGASCDPVLVDCVEGTLRRMGYGVQRNKPYAGGFITEYFGNAARACEALQIEVNRSLYMNERTLEKNAAFDQIAADMTQMLMELEACAASQIEARGVDAAARAAE
ncbi:MAG: N-formylglutamate amidohydrolase [Hyphomicrobiales bacterium]|jgi:N-formylglutamate amidohydrolase|nr:N-formylglutamate amidohydrolase [Hyphomicrobiales bacterium]